MWGIVLSLNVRSETGRTSSGSGSGSAPTNQPHHLAPPSLGKLIGVPNKIPVPSSPSIGGGRGGPLSSP